MERKTPNYAFGFAIFGFLFGLLLVAVATLVALSMEGLPVTPENFISIHFENPLLWLFDLMPFVMAIILGMVGARETTIVKLRREVSGAAQRRNAEVQRVTAELSKKDQDYKQIESVISRAKKEWEATFDSVSDMIFVTDCDGNVTRCNRALSNAFALSFNELIGGNVDDLFFGERGSPTAYFPEQHAEIKFPKLDGWYEVESNPFMIEEGQFGTVFIVRDITDRKQIALDLQRQKQYYEALVKDSPIAIVTLSMDQKVVDCNPAFERLFGFNRHEVLSQNIDNLIAPDDLVEETRSLSDTVGKGEVVHQVTHRRRRDGSHVEVELYGIPVVLWAKQIGILGMYHDLTGLVGAPVLETSVEVAEELPEAETEAGVAEAIAQGLEEPDLLKAALMAAGGVALAEATRKEDEQGVGEEGETAEETPGEEANLDAAGVAALAALAETGGGGEQAVELEAIIPPSEEVKPAYHRKIKINIIEGIGPVYSEKLAQVNIHSTEDFLNVASTRKGREDLAEQTGISGKLILKWINRADLMRVPGIGEEYSDLLEAAGVDTVKELRHRNPDNLYNTLLEINTEKRLVRRAPHLSEVQSWIEASKEIDPLVTY